MTGEEIRERRTKNNPPKRSVLEEVGNSVTHGLGACFGIAGMILLLLRSCNAAKAWAAAIYGACFIIMFLMSCLYHSFIWGTKVKRLWRRFDYLSIYLLIGGTFTPLWLVFTGGTAGLAGFIVEWAVILTGVTIVAVFGPDRMRKLHLSLYVVLGWCGLLFLPRMIRENIMLFVFILAGGVIYTLGIIPFALKKKGAHFVWHFFVLFGAIVHWFGIYLYVYGPCN